eukprot:scaffold12534_cov157-Isochrysis_galbana.AAC.2
MHWELAGQMNSGKETEASGRRRSLVASCSRVTAALYAVGSEWADLHFLSRSVRKQSQLPHVFVSTLVHEAPGAVVLVQHGQLCCIREALLPGGWQLSWACQGSVLGLGSLERVRLRKQQLPCHVSRHHVSVQPVPFWGWMHGVVVQRALHLYQRTGHARLHAQQGFRGEIHPHYVHPQCQSLLIIAAVSFRSTQLPHRYPHRRHDGHPGR